MADFNVEDFRTKYGSYIKAIANVDCDPKNFNVFNILGIQNYEIRHSSFFVWLLKNDRFCKEFIDRCRYKNKCDLDSFDFSDVNSDRVIETEKFFYEVDKSGNLIYREIKATNDIENDNSLKKKHSSYIQRRIDILIVSEKYTITIENKVDSDEHDNQCIAYKNYIDNCCDYKGRKHFYVFLAKKEPDKFAEAPEYAGYCFIDYDTIKQILEDLTGDFDPVWSAESNPDEYSIVNQYITVINEWKEFPLRYKRVFEEGEFDLEPFADDNYEKIFNTKFKEQLSDSEIVFTEIAHKYYKSIKESIDSIIDPSLREISKDPLFIKENYNRGNYAKAIPVSFDDLGNEIIRNKYLEARCKSGNKIITKEDVLEEKRKGKLKNFFKSVDYRAPRGAFKQPSIAIVSGLNSDYSVNLCSDLSLNNSRILNYIPKLKTSGWKTIFEYYMKDGGKFHQVCLPLSCDEETMLKILMPIRQEIFENQFRSKTQKAYEIADGKLIKYLQYLGDNKVFCQKDIKKFINEIFDYYFKINDEGVNASIGIINDFLNNQSLIDYSESYLKWKKANGISVSNYDSFIKLIGCDSTMRKKITDICEISSFNSWLIEQMPPKKRGKKSIKDHLMLPDSPFKDWISQKADLLDQRERREAYFAWSMTLFYELTEEESKCKETMKDAFKKKTIEGVSAFGYADWFKKVIFVD